MITFREIGQWLPGQVVVAAAPSTRVVLPHVEQAIDRAWADASARLGDKLFDGPMCRLERCEATPAALRLWVSPTSYKPFLGTDLTGGRDVPTEARANPLGLSAALATADGFLMLGRRNANVAYYPNRVHPFAGSLEPDETSNVFHGVLRELAEELGFTSDDVGEMRCLGIIEDAGLLQPEVIFSASSSRTRREVESTVDGAEHHACVAIEASARSITDAMRDTRLTPVAVGTLALWGRVAFGEEWFDAQRRRLTTPVV